MEKDVLTQERRLLRRNKWAYSVGGIGRDMIYQLIATFFITYIQYSGLGLTAAQFSVIGVLLVVGRIWDAVNDPFMGSIVENTHSRWGKFRPWILIGALLSGIVIVIMFNFRSPAQWLGGWGYVIFFFIIYLLWEAAFTLNDIPYWSLIPALSKNKKDRDVITTMVVVFAGIGAFAGNAIISLTTVGNMVRGYSLISISFVAIFLACTFLTVFGVKEPAEEYDEKAEKVTLKKMFSVIAHNDQLLWASLALMLYSIGSALLTALGYNWFYLEIGYNGTLTMIFIVSFAVSNIVVQSLYAALAKKFTRKQLMRFSFISLVFGYTMLLTLGWGGFLPVNIVTACLFGLFVFGGQAIFYMVIIVNMTNTIEYNEYKTGDRNEAIVFSLRPFVAKLSSAIQGLVVILVLVLSGIYGMSQNISELENQLSIFNEMTLEQKQEYYAHVMAGEVVLDQVDLKDSEKAVIYAALQDPANAVFTINTDPADSIPDGSVTGMTIDKAADAVFKNNESVDVPMRLILRLAITVLPSLLIGSSMWLLNKKFVIDETYYEKITAETRQRRQQSSGTSAS
jgi:melibiose permease/lactose/raffinose/galactose permease